MIVSLGYSRFRFDTLSAQIIYYGRNARQVRFVSLFETKDVAIDISGFEYEIDGIYFVNMGYTK